MESIRQVTETADRSFLTEKAALAARQRKAEHAKGKRIGALEPELLAPSDGNEQHSGVSRPELLAPVGGKEQLKYAVHFGADAVYFATDRFGLRQRADNFFLEEIPQAVAFAHAAGVKVFVTCNAYMHDSDIESLPHYLQALSEAGVDALIISDLGTLRLAKKYAPQVALHISTQAACSNTESALMWYELGARRIVCAREMSLEEITSMREKLPADLELEVFAHGAMCMAISGRCLISDYLTERSANSGHCTQPCRWDYSVGDYYLEEKTRPGNLYPIEEDSRGTYLMSAKDLNMLSHLDDLTEAGINSIKIEGRNKKAFYVATVVNAYRQVLDGADAASFSPELETISHRPYSTGFFYGAAEQSIKINEYIQSHDWVAEVLSCDQVSEETLAKSGESGKSGKSGESGESATWRIKIACRNRLYEGDVLQILSPYRSIENVEIKNLCSVYADGTEKSIKMANRSMATYAFTSSIPLSESDILRSERKDPNKKN